MHEIPDNVPRMRCVGSRTASREAGTPGSLPTTKLDAIDPRLIPGARFVRALGLDELPQLINVFRGEMSWVGPRPCTKFESESYTADQKQRFAALPGLTGLWQVSGKNNTSFQQMVDLDIRYSYPHPQRFADHADNSPRAPGAIGEYHRSATPGSCRRRRCCRRQPNPHVQPRRFGRCLVGSPHHERNGLGFERSAGLIGPQLGGMGASAEVP